MTKLLIVALLGLVSLEVAHATEGTILKQPSHSLVRSLAVLFDLTRPESSSAARSGSDPVNIASVRASEHVLSPPLLGASKLLAFKSNLY